MIVIRLSRVGKKKQPTYRLLIQDRQRDPWGDPIEIVGNYNPRTETKKLVMNEERVKYWLSKGAQPSATVHNLLVKAGIIKGGKKRATTHDRKAPATAETKEEKPAA